MICDYSNTFWAVNTLECCSSTHLRVWTTAPFSICKTNWSDSSENKNKTEIFINRLNSERWSKISWKMSTNLSRLLTTKVRSIFSRSFAHFILLCSYFNFKNGYMLRASLSVYFFLFLSLFPPVFFPPCFFLFHSHSKCVCLCGDACACIGEHTSNNPFYKAFSICVQFVRKFWSHIFV